MISIDNNRLLRISNKQWYNEIISNVAMLVTILTDFLSQEVFYQEIDCFCRGEEE